MKVEAFPRCCGLKIIHGFGGFYPDEKAKRQALLDAFKEARGMDHYGLVNIMVTLSKDQKPQWDTILREFEFYEVGLELKNPFHNNRRFHVYIWNQAEERENILKLINVPR